MADEGYSIKDAALNLGFNLPALGKPVEWLTRREYFAALAMASLTRLVPKESAKIAVEHADALIAELDRPPPPAQEPPK